MCNIVLIEHSDGLLVKRVNHSDQTSDLVTTSKSVIEDVQPLNTQISDPVTTSESVREDVQSPITRHDAYKNSHGYFLMCDIVLIEPSDGLLIKILIRCLI